MEEQNQNQETPITIEALETEQESNLSNTPATQQPTEPATEEPAPVDNRPTETSQNEEQPDPGQSNNEDQPTLIDDIKSRIGVDIDAQSFEETEEGVAQFATRAAEQIARQEFDRIINQDPLVKDVIEYQHNGGNPRDILYTQYPETDYTKVQIEDDNTDQHKQIIKDYFKRLGESEDTIQEHVNDLEQAGKLSERARTSLDKLAQAQKEDAERIKQQKKQEEEKRQQEAKQFWDDMWNDLSKKSTINGITIPENEKRGFFEYISNPVTQDGLAKADVDRSKRDVDTQMMHDYIDYLANVKGMSLQQLIKQSTNSSATRTLREKLNKENQKDKGSGQNPNDESTGQTGYEEPDLNQTMEYAN